MKFHKKSPWIILVMGLITIVLMMWGMQSLVEQAAPVTPLIQLAKAIRDLYSFEQVAVVRMPAVGDPAVLRITYKAGSSSRTFESPDAEMANVAKFARSQFDFFGGSWQGITTIELERTGPDDSATGRKIPLAELAPGARRAPVSAWKQVWAATPMGPEAAAKLNRWVVDGGNERWRLNSTEVAHAELSTWLVECARVPAPSEAFDHALAQGWIPVSEGPEALVWGWRGDPGEFRVTVRPTRLPDGKGGIFLAVKIEELPGTAKSAAPAPVGKTRTVFLKAAGTNTIGVIKLVRAHTGLGLQEALNLVEAAPCGLKSGMTPEAAEKFRKELEAAGATVEVQ